MFPSSLLLWPKKFSLTQIQICSCFLVTQHLILKKKVFSWRALLRVLNISPSLEPPARVSSINSKASLNFICSPATLKEKALPRHCHQWLLKCPVLSTPISGADLQLTSTNWYLLSCDWLWSWLLCVSQNSRMACFSASFWKPDFYKINSKSPGL